MLEDQAVLLPSYSEFPDKSVRTPSPRRHMRPTATYPSSIAVGIGR
jgi:hypothetical protein